MRAWRMAAGSGGLAPVSTLVERETILTFAEQRLLLATRFLALADFAGKYTVQALANALACQGGEPHSLWATLLLPAEGNPAAESHALWAEMSDFAKKLEVDWRGEESRCMPAVREPLVACQMFAFLAVPRPYQPHGIQAGDQLILTKSLGDAAAALMAYAREQELSEAFDLKFAKRCQQLAGVEEASVLAAARCAWKVNGIHALHDLFQAGLAGVLHGLLDQVNLDVEIDPAQIELLPEVKLLCEYFGVDPLTAFAPGALLIVGEPSACEAVLGRLRLARIPARLIGRVLEAGEGRWLVDGAERIKLPRVTRDPLAAIVAPGQPAAQ